MLVGQSKGSANSSLSQRGFVMRDSDKTDYNGRYTTWWRSSSEQCITVNTRDGYVYTIQTARPAQLPLSALFPLDHFHRLWVWL